MQDFRYERRVAFSDTDAMGVVHHANYLRYVEEARVAWMRVTGLGVAHYPQSDKTLAVLSYQMWHLKPARFEDLLHVRLQVRRLKLRVQFQYSIYKEDVIVAQAETLHIPLDKDLRPVRLDPRFITQLEKEKWTETWLLNS